MIPDGGIKMLKNEYDLCLTGEVRFTRSCTRHNCTICLQSLCMKMTMIMMVMMVMMWWWWWWCGGGDGDGGGDGGGDNGDGDDGGGGDDDDGGDGGDDDGDDGDDNSGDGDDDDGDGDGGGDDDSNDDEWWTLVIRLIDQLKTIFNFRMPSYQRWLNFQRILLVLLILIIVSENYSDCDYNGYYHNASFHSIIQVTHISHSQLVLWLLLLDYFHMCNCLGWLLVLVENMQHRCP